MNIFICQTPFQLFFVNQIIRHFKIEERVAKKVLIFHSSLNVISNTPKDNIEYYNLGNESRMIKRFIKFKKAIRLIDKIITTSNHRVDFFIPHTSGLLSNYIYYNKKLASKRNIDLNFFYEGILYFYDFEEKFQKFHIQRNLLAVLLGFRYRYNMVILPYNSIKIKHIYTPIKEFTKGESLKIIEIPFNQEHQIEINTNHYLILGGPVVFLKKFYEESIKQIINLSKKEFTIYYKGHSSFDTHNTECKNIFFDIISKYNINYIELSSMDPVELLIDKVKPVRIYSYYSSALLNISLMYPNNLSIICYLDSGNKHFRMFKSIFNYFKIKTVFIN